MSDEFPEIAHRGPYQLVNLEELEREIDERFSRDVEALEDLQIRRRRSGSRDEVVRIGGKIEGLKLQRDKAIAAIRRAAGVQR